MALDRHLVAEVKPLANEKNIILWRDYRVTVLQDRLFRIEQSAERKFRDDATLSVWFRNMPEQAFSVHLTESQAIIETDKCSLIIKPSRKDCRVLISGEEKKISNAENFYGTYRTLDVCDGGYFIDYQNKTKKKIKLGTGVCSATGVAVIDDSETLSLGLNGEVLPETGSGTDEYVFCYGKDFRSAVKALYLITGNAPLIPRFALGNWWSRYYAYSDREYLKLLNRFEERDIPLTVATIDMDWHYSKNLDAQKGITEKGRNTEFYGGNNGWTGYSWNPELFPDYRDFLRKIKEKNLKITLNLHPADGIRWFEDCYEDVAKAVGVDPESGERIKFNIADTQFINNYFSKIHKPYEKDGVTFWWIDWQQGTETFMKGLDPLWSLNHYHYLDNAVNHAPLILSRFAGVGSHRYPLGFSGDTMISWKTLEYLPYFTLTASNVGYTWWSHDIGGHMLGTMNEELYLRHIQFGVFSPINRLHCSDDETTTKEPWVYGNGTGIIAGEWFKLRHKMIPFLYSCDYRNHKDGLALVEPLYYKWADNKEAYDMKSEYVFGENFIVAPVYTPLAKDGYSYTEVWIPEGKWTDIFTGDEYSSPVGGIKKTLMRKLESIPVLAKDGTIFPLSGDSGNYAGNPKKLDVQIYNGNGGFTLYEDGSETDLTGEAFTSFVAEYAVEGEIGVQTVKISSNGDFAVIPKDRVLRLVFKNIPEGKVSLYQDGVEVPVKDIIADYAVAEFEFDPNVEYTVKVEFLIKSKMSLIIDRARKILVSSEGSNPDKLWNCWKWIEKAQSVDEYVNTVEQSKVTSAVKARLLEIL